MRKIDWNPSEAKRKLQSVGTGHYDQHLEPTIAHADVYNNNLLVFQQWGYITPSGTEIMLGDKEHLLATTQVYDQPFDVTSVPAQSSPTLLSVRKATLTQTGYELISNGLNPAILSEADGQIACGAYSHGAWGQEEYLCRVSTLSLSLCQLSNRLEPDDMIHFKAAKCNVINKDAYPLEKEYGGIYSKVIVFRDGPDTGYAFRGNPFEIGIISVPPLSFRRAWLQHNPIDGNFRFEKTYQADSLGSFTSEGKVIMENKVRTILRIALSHGHDSLVLGAWGCDTHGHNPEIITSLLGQILEEKEFKDKLREVVFAIPEQEPYATIHRLVTSKSWTPPTVPNRFCYRIGEDRIWGCEYPGDRHDSIAIVKLGKALEFGITHFIDLTEKGELNPYSHFLPSKVSYRRFPIRDVSIPTSIHDTYCLMEQIREILNEPRNRIYLHCWGGVGRTGTIAACWIAFSRHTDFETTMQMLGEYWKQCPKSHYRIVPEHISQHRFIRDFIAYLKQQDNSHHE